MLGILKEARSIYILFVTVAACIGFQIVIKIVLTIVLKIKSDKVREKSKDDLTFNDEVPEN